MPSSQAAARRTRLWPIDAIRGLAVAGMVFYHLMWDLYFVGIYPGDVTQGGWRVFARFIATTFLVLVGFNISLLNRRTPGGVPYRRWLERGLKVLGWGMVISLVTWPIFGRQFIAYGVLHFIGTALLLAPLLLKVEGFAVPLGLAFLAGGRLLGTRYVDTVWLLPLGLRPWQYTSVDYFPLIPWLGVVLLGVGLGPLLVPRLGTRPGPEAPAPTPRWARPAVFLGRHSLVIYILHQPVIIAVLMLSGVRFV